MLLFCILLIISNFLGGCRVDEASYTGTLRQHSLLLISLLLIMSLGFFRITISSFSVVSLKNTNSLVPYFPCARFLKC